MKFQGLYKWNPLNYEDEISANDIDLLISNHADSICIVYSDYSFERYNIRDILNRDSKGINIVMPEIEFFNMVKWL